jgi:DNA-binding CsgD family transcriptional regulator
MTRVERRRILPGRQLGLNANPISPARAPVFLLPSREQPAALSRRELQVLGLMAEGCTNAEIGLRLRIAEETAKTHVRHLLAKLQAHSRAHAVGIAFRQRLLS